MSYASRLFVLLILWFGFVLLVVNFSHKGDIAITKWKTTPIDYATIAKNRTNTENSIEIYEEDDLPVDLDQNGWIEFNSEKAGLKTKVTFVYPSSWITVGSINTDTTSLVPFYAKGDSLTYQEAITGESVAKLNFRSAKWHEPCNTTSDTCLWDLKENELWVSFGIVNGSYVDFFMDGTVENSNEVFKKIVDSFIFSESIE